MQVDVVQRDQPKLKPTDDPPKGCWGRDLSVASFNSHPITRAQDGFDLSDCEAMQGALTSCPISE